MAASDTVVLPSVANYNESVGAGKTLGWTGTPASQFFTSSKPGNNYNVSGSDGNYYIVGGSGTDNIVISGSGSSYFTPGSGTEAVTIKGGGYVKATGILTGSSTIGSSGSTLEITQPNAGTITFDPVPQVNGSAGSGGTLIIDGTNFPTNGTISGLQIGDTIDLKDVSFSGGGAIGLTSGNILQVIEGGKSYLLRLGGTTSDYNSGSWRLSSDGHSGTNIQFVSGLTINFSWDPSVKNADFGFQAGDKFGRAILPEHVHQCRHAQFSHRLRTDPSGGGTPMAANAIGESLPTFDTGGRTASLTTQPLASVTSALSAMNAPGAAFLPATGPAGRTLWLDPGEAIALGLIIERRRHHRRRRRVWRRGQLWTYSGAVGTSSYDIIGTAEHEISELMGRRDDLDGAGHYDPFDLFMYTSSGAHDYVVLPIKPSAYFSIDGGATNLGFLNTNPAGDLNDWKSGANPPNSAGFVDPYNTPSSQGVIRRAGVADATVMSALGWKTSAPASAVSSGSIIISAILSAGGAVLNVLSGGVASAVQLYSGAKEIVSGLDVGAVVSDGAFQFLAAGGSAINTILNDPGIQVVSSGATATSAVLSGGEQDVYGTAGSTVVSSGGIEIVYSGGTTSNTTVSNGGTLELFSGAIASGTIISSGGILEIGSGYTTSNYVVSSDVTLEVAAGGIASGTTVLSGGTLELTSGGTESATTVSSGGVLELFGGAVLSGTTTIASGGIVQVASGYSLTVGSGQSSAGVVVLSGGIEIVSSGGLDGGAIISSGGNQIVFGSAVNGVFVRGNEVVRSGGVTTNTTLSSGAAQNVSSGGVASGTQVLAGAQQNVVAGGLGSGTQVSGGAVVNRGTELGLHIANGGQVQVSSGGSDSGTTVDNGGIENLLGGTATAHASFRRGAAVRLVGWCRQLHGDLGGRHPACVHQRHGAQRDGCQCRLPAGVRRHRKRRGAVERRAAAGQLRRHGGRHGGLDRRLPDRVTGLGQLHDAEHQRLPVPLRRRLGDRTTVASGVGAVRPGRRRRRPARRSRAGAFQVDSGHGQRHDRERRRDPVRVRRRDGERHDGQEPRASSSTTARPSPRP